jgi:hypothetical protein
MSAEIHSQLATLRSRVAVCERATQTLRRFADHQVLDILLGDYGDAADVLAVDKVEGRKRRHVWKPPPSGGDAATVAYTPADATDWVDPDPAFVAPALDQLADRVHSLEDSPPWTAFNVPYTPGDGDDWVDPDPANVGDALDDCGHLLTMYGALLGNHETRITTVEAWTAADIPYIPATGTHWLAPVPDDVKEGLDQLAARESRRKSIGIQIPVPAAGDYYVLMHFPTGQGCEIRRLLGKTPAGSGDTCGVRLFKRNEFNYDVSTGQPELTSSALTLDDNGAETSSFALTTLMEKQVLVVKIDSTAGNPDWVWVQVEYQET